MVRFKKIQTNATRSFFDQNKKLLYSFNDANNLIKQICGINKFFNSQNEALELIDSLENNRNIEEEIIRRDFGDFQTNRNLASQIVKGLFSESCDFEFILEPTCGIGNFIIASILELNTLKKIVGVDIHLPYVWATKFNILTVFLENKIATIPEIDIIHANAFEYSYKSLADSTKELKSLIIGNPPWVTNSELGTTNSSNLPIKSNFKKHNGFDAITGKGNFDIGEYITLRMLDCFQNHNGIFAFLIKNSVVKNIIHDQTKNRYRISKSEQLNIDSKKEFNVSVNASLFTTHLNTEPSLTCIQSNFYDGNLITEFGWYKNKFVYSISDYDEASCIEGKSTFVWRSGVKHDCSKVMELESVDGNFINGLGEIFKLEKKLVFGLLKSSDLKGTEIDSCRKQVIITQKSVGQDTGYIKDRFPKLYRYLSSHIQYFNKRKSSIYKDKPEFSIFGVGDYSFKKYKVAISGLYKSTHFTLVYPYSSKPIMLDDTCYFIGFDRLEYAQIAHFLLNSDKVQKFLKSIIFMDSKRPINKDVLMRIDLENGLRSIDYNSIKSKFNNISIEDWEQFRHIIERQDAVQSNICT